MLTVDQAWRATTVLLGLATLLQALELPWLFARGWSWPLLREEFAAWPEPILKFLDLLYHGARLAWIQGASALLLLTADLSAAAWMLLLTTALASLRFRGTVNGGSDSMTLVLLVPVAVGSAWPQLRSWCLFYIAAQSLVSYLMAGLAKSRNPDWWNGRALLEIGKSTTYSIPRRFRRALRSATFCRLAGWSLLGFQLSFAALPWSGQTLPAVLLAGCGFHALNFVLFGLNRFFWVWIATYPSLLLAFG